MGSKGKTGPGDHSGDYVTVAIPIRREYAEDLLYALTQALGGGSSKKGKGKGKDGKGGKNGKDGGKDGGKDSGKTGSTPRSSVRARQRR